MRDTASYPADGVAMIAAERQRQITAEGWTREHDAEHVNDELARAAACYAMPAMFRAYVDPMCPAGWPWHRSYWKPGDRIRELVKAGALIAAEIDRLRAVSDQSGWPAHLRDDAPFRVCDRCGRKTWSVSEFGRERGMTQRYDAEAGWVDPCGGRFPA